MPQSAVVGRLRPGDHVCWTYDDDTVRDRILAASVLCGVERRQQVICAADVPVAERAAPLLAEHGVDVDDLLRSGGLVVRTAEESYLRGGRFDAGEVLDGWAATIRTARDRGYAGVRAVGDMGWAAGPVPGGEGLEGYEERATALLAEGFALGVCLYDLRLFPQERLDPVVRAHPASIGPVTGPVRVRARAAGGWDPSLRLAWFHGRLGLRAEGEIDLSNRTAFLALLDELVRTPRGEGLPALDVGGVDFVDAPTARAVLAALRRPGGLELVGVRPPVLRVLTMVDAGAHPRVPH